MDALNNTTLIRLRDRLRERGQRSSFIPPEAEIGLPDSARELLKISTEYGALCEAMYLMMAADGRVLNVEREVLKGALRTLTNDTVRGLHIEALLDTAAKRLATEGQEARLRAVLRELRADAITAEVAFVLAAAIAVADGTLHVKERALLDQFAQELSIEHGQVERIMRELEQEEGELEEEVANKQKTEK